MSRGPPIEYEKSLQLLQREIERLRLHVAPPCKRIPKLLVLDLNGLLVHRVFMNGSDPASHPALPRVATTWVVNNFLVYERPHVRDFLRFCLDNYYVGIWTTASMHNATPLIEGLFQQEDAEKLVFIWDGKKCTFNGQTDPLKPGKPIAFKELKRLWESKELAGLFGPSNTLLIDDSLYKAQLNPEHTAIHPPAWDDPERLADDAFLSTSGKLRRYLESMLSAESVPEFVSSNPFEDFKPIISLTDLLQMQQGHHFNDGPNANHNAAAEGQEAEDDEDEIVLAPMGRLAI